MVQHWMKTVGSMLLVTLVFLASGELTAKPPLSALTILETTALRLAPQSTSYFATSLKLKERLMALWNTRAIQKAWKTDLVQMAWGRFHQLFEHQAGPLHSFLEQKENKEALQLLLDMASEECFIMGGENLPSFFTLLSEIYGSLTAGNFINRMGLGMGDPGIDQLHSLFEALQANRDSVVAPDVVVGFKVPDAAVAKRQLARLSVLLNTAALAVPQLTGNVKSQKVKDSSFTTVVIDGAKIPWNQIPWDEIEEDPGEFDELKTHLKEMKITLCLGYHEGYIMFGVGPSMGYLRSLGTGKKLSDLPEFEPVKKHLDKKFTGLGYSNAVVNRGSGFTQKDADKMVEDVTEMLEASSLDDTARDRIQRDMKDFGTDLLTFFGHDVGPAINFSFATERGEESYHYQYSVDRRIDFSKPLDALQHVGGDPVFAMMGRATYTPGNWDLAVKWAKKAHFYFREYGLPQLEQMVGADMKEKIEQLLEDLAPLAERFSKTVKTNLLPALADGQSGLVIDNKLVSTQWHKSMPSSKAPLPLLEPAMVMSVSDAAKLKKSATDIRACFNDLVKAAQKFEPSIAEYNIHWPSPEQRTLEGVDLFWYSFPEALDLDGRLRPSAGVSKNLCALGISNEHIMRLMQPTPLVVDGGPLADRNRPLGSATIFNMTALVKTAEPWVAFAIEQHGDDQVKSHVADIKTIIQSLHYFERYTSATYVEGKTTVTHGEWRVRDIK
jgi:hypothetical protein